MQMLDANDPRRFDDRMIAQLLQQQSQTNEKLDGMRDTFNKFLLDFTQWKAEQKSDTELLNSRADRLEDDRKTANQRIERIEKTQETQGMRLEKMEKGWETVNGRVVGMLITISTAVILAVLMSFFVFKH